MMRAIRYHYTDVKVTVVLRDRTFGSVSIGSGIKQGDPAFGSLWALAFDPILRFALAVLPLTVIGAFADDVAMVVKCLLALIDPLIPFLITLRKAANLQLNFPKCNFVVTSSEHVDRLRCAIAAIGSRGRSKERVLWEAI